MAIFAGSEKLENSTRAQNSHFIMGKNKFLYRNKQKTLMVLLQNLWNKIQKYEENNSNQKEMHFYKK